MIKNLFVILAGANDKDNKRCQKVVDFIEENEVNHYQIICTGGSAVKNADKKVIRHSELMREYLVNKGIKKSDVSIVVKGLDTLGDIVFSYSLVKKSIDKGCENLFFVTERFHMPRLKYIVSCVYNGDKNGSFNFDFIEALNNKRSLLEKVKFSLVEKLVLLSLKHDFKKFNLKCFSDYSNFVNNVEWYRDRSLDKGKKDKKDFINDSWYNSLGMMFYKFQN